MKGGLKNAQTRSFKNYKKGNFGSEANLEELIGDNKDYIEWLEKTYGQKAVDKFIQDLKDELAMVPPTGTKIKMKLIEESFGDDPKK